MAKAKGVEGKERRKFLDDMHSKFDIKKKWKHEAVSSGILALDKATSKGGIPRGLLVDLYGDEGLGKTTMSLSMIAERMRSGEHCAFIDVEHRLMPELKATIIPQDVDEELLEIFQPRTGEVAFGIIERLLNERPEFRMIVLDSVAALVFEEETEYDKYSGPIALLARRVGNFSKKIMATIYEYGALVVFINQMRTSPNPYGPMFKTSTGGKAVRFLSSLRLNMQGNQLIKKGEDIIGQKVKVKIEKNSCGAPHRETLVSIVYGEGIDRVRDVVDCGIDAGVIVQNGGYYKLRQTDDKGKVIRDIQAHGEAAFVAKVEPELDEVRKFVSDSLAEQAQKRAAESLAKKATTSAAEDAGEDDEESDDEKGESDDKKGE
jgi:recombination protein RecA